MTPNDSGLRKESLIYVTTVMECSSDMLIQRYPRWWKLKRGIAWLLCSTEPLPKRVRKKYPSSGLTNENEKEAKYSTVSESSWVMLNGHPFPT